MIKRSESPQSPQSSSSIVEKSSAIAAQPIKPLQFSGISVIKFLHVLIQFLFIPIGLNHLQHLYQILLPLPTGYFVVISALSNILIFTLNLFDSSPFVKLKKCIDSGSDQSNFSVQTGRFTRLFKRNPRIVGYKKHRINSNSIESFGEIHDNGAWFVLYALGCGWAIHLLYLSIPLLKVNSLNQGVLFFAYGCISLVFYLLMILIPERKLAFYDQKTKKPVYIVLPAVVLSFPFHPKLRSCKKFLYNFSKSLGLESNNSNNSNNSNSSNSSNGLALFLSRDARGHISQPESINRLIMWGILWIIGGKLTFNLFNYQFIGPLIFILWIYEIRQNITKNQDIGLKPVWYYIFWILILYETGFKFWYNAGFMLFSIYKPWGIFILTGVAYSILIFYSLKELKNINNINNQNKNYNLVMKTIFIILIVLPVSALLSLNSMIPIYLSILEFGPLA